jgi:hypothetical protein
VVLNSIQEKPLAICHLSAFSLSTILPRGGPTSSESFGKIQTCASLTLHRTDLKQSGKR